MINKLKVLIILLASVLSFSDGYACSSISSPKQLNLGINLESKTHFFYNSVKILQNKPGITIKNCTPAAETDSFLMVGLALENEVLANLVRSYSLNDELSIEGDKCKLANNPFQEQLRSERANSLREKRKFLESCMIVQVTDFSSKGLNYPEFQPACVVTRYSKNSADFKGSFCFFKTLPDSVFSIHLEADPRCYEKSFLAENNIALQDIKLALTTYLAGDASGRSPDLKALSTTDTRFSINPLKSLIPVSEEYDSNSPVWPSSWQGGSVELGMLQIVESIQGLSKIILPFVVDTRCPRVCEKNLCSSPCDYAQPIIGRFELAEKIKGKYEYLKGWQDGGISPPQWQGILYGVGDELRTSYLTVGSEYQITVEFDEPDVSFAQFDGRIHRMLGFRTNHLGELSSNGSLINTIPLITDVDLTDQIPLFDTITGLRHNGQELNELFARAVNSFNGYLNNSFWPPYYENICDPTTHKCKKLGSGKVKLTLRFKLGEKDNQGKFAIENALVSRESNLGLQYPFRPLHPAFIQCDNSPAPITLPPDFDFDL